MILRKLRVQHFRCFRNPVELDGLGMGVHVIHAPNETGKSSLVLALARALFDRHGTRDKEIIALRPWGTSLSPAVSLEFESRGARYRLEKVFLEGAKSRLDEWKDGRFVPLAESQAADEFVRGLLFSGGAPTGATKVGQWGLARLLWLSQSPERHVLPGLDATLKSRLMEAVGVVALSNPEQRMLKRVEETYLGFFTPKKGGVAKRSELEKRETEVLELQKGVEALRAQRDATAEHAREIEEASNSLVELMRERSDYEARLVALQERWDAEVKLEQQLALREKDVQRQRQVWEGLDQKQRELLALRQTVARHQSAVAERGPAIQRAQEALLREEAALLESRDAVLAQSSEQEKAEQRLERGRLLEKAREVLAEQHRLEGQLKQAERLEGLVVGLRRKVSASKSVSEADLKRAEEAERKQRQAQDRLEVQGIQVLFTPEGARTIEWEVQGHVQRHKLAEDEQKLFVGVTAGSLRIKDVGEVRVSTGAEELGKVQAEVEKHRKEVARRLQEHGVKTLSELRAKWEEQQAVQKEEEKHAEALAACLESAGFEEVEVLREVAREHAGKVGALAGQLDLAVEALSTYPYAEVNELSEALKQRKQEARAREKVKVEAETLYRQVERHLRGLLQEREGAQESARALELELKARLESEGLSLEQLGARVEAAGSELARLENMVKGLRERLPRPEERASSQRRQLQESRERVLDAEKAARERIIRSEALLGQAAESGVYSRLGEAEERLALAVEAHQQLQLRATAADLLRKRIRHWQEQVHRTFVAPMEDAVQRRLMHIRGEGMREALVLGPDLDEASLRLQEDERDLTQFSWGTQEQTLFALRLALGELLSKQGARVEPQLLVLDDALVNTDPARHRRALDLIDAAGESLQVLVLTAFPERYRTLRTAKEFDLRALARGTESVPG
ncbi:hypothetical protein LZ198_06025 [Myxococcus sp. K15C18031901]|uniref:hypothetical protein n=1 Tax=Myxococcus dinghuensis TaxID=2906761 RepID=UPI0020A71C1D|nr:hypothetical protein [Myxococcus dinghuensis]MCP3098433.1 hypothetical protein [Myxococcus dinghuensis]